MKTPFTGGCMCGNIRYECSAEPLVMGNCHCRDCQKATGTAFAAAILVPRNAITIAGDVKYYDVTGDSGGIVSRGFLPNHLNNDTYPSSVTFRSKQVVNKPVYPEA